MPKTDKAPRFTFLLDGVFKKLQQEGSELCSTITDRDGNVAEVYKDGESYKAKLIETKLTDEKKITGLCNRMADWYYFNHVKGKE